MFLALLRWRDKAMSSSEGRLGWMNISIVLLINSMLTCSWIITESKHSIKQGFCPWKKKKYLWIAAEVAE